jgi:hypothetical protein
MTIETKADAKSSTPEVRVLRTAVVGATGKRTTQ